MRLLLEAKKAFLQSGVAATRLAMIIFSKNISFSVMLITGIFGNLAVCCVILRIPTMKTATNYYLFSLAVADLLILLVGKFFYWYLD